MPKHPVKSLILASFDSLVTDKALQTYQAMQSQLSNEDFRELELLYAPEVDQVILKVFRAMEESLINIIIDSCSPIVLTLFVHRILSIRHVFENDDRPDIHEDMVSLYNLLITWPYKYTSK